MALLNASLLVGSLLVAIPIILHLTMRQRPKRVVFPAVRFVLPRREANTRKLNLRRWLLLALRCAAIILLALALARPSVASHMLSTWLMAGGAGSMGLLCGLLAVAALVGQRGRWLTLGLAAAAVMLVATSGVLAITAWRDAPASLGPRQAPVAAVLVFDTSPRMLYRHENKSRLEEAGEMARWLIGQLPAGSEVALLDSRTRAAVFAVDPAAAAKAAERLQVAYVPRALPLVLEDALQLIATSSRTHKEIYIFTDLADAAWPAPDLAPLKSRLESVKDVSFFVVDVGVPQPSNVALGQVRLSRETMPRDGTVTIESELISEAIDAERVVQLLVEQPDPTRPVVRDGKVLLPEMRPRGRSVAQLKAGDRHALEFEITQLPVGIHHGQLQILGQDALAVDDVRYFSVQVQEAWPVLLAAPPGASMRFVAESLAPFDLRQQGAARFDCVQIPVDELGDAELERYAAVCLLDPPPLDEPVWTKLNDYVRAGGGLAILLGSHARSPGEFNSSNAQPLLAGALTRQWRAAERELFLAPSNLQHPVTSAFRGVATNTPWNMFPIFRHWGLELAEDAQPIIRFSNQQVALAERLVGQGKVLTMTTPMSDTARPPGRRPWNELAFGENPWPQFILINEMMLYLVAEREAKLNYVVGQAVNLPFREDLDPPRFQLFPPDGEPYDVLGADERLTVRFTETPGSYRLRGNRGGIVSRGFSTNLPVEATRLQRVDTKLLEETLGKDRFEYVRERQQIQRAQGRERSGQEFYPLLMVGLALVLALEHVMANRFYRRQEV